MIKIAQSEPSCDPKYILQNLGALKKDTNKISYISDTLERCAITTTTTKKKRPMTGYNCFVRVMSKRGNKNVIKSRAWSTLEDKQKETWKNSAKEGCLPRLWEN